MCKIRGGQNVRCGCGKVTPHVCLILELTVISFLFLIAVAVFISLLFPDEKTAEGGVFVSVV